MRQYPLLRRLTSVLVTASLLAGMFLVSFSAAIADAETERISIGSELTAVLSPDGVLTLEGTGQSDDFTPDTAPLRDYADRITRVVIPDGVTRLGDCLFYGCYRLTGTLTLPAGLLELGDRVFSGPSAAEAPHFTYIFNDFTSLEAVTPAAPQNTDNEGDDGSAAQLLSFDVEPYMEEEPSEPEVTPEPEPSAEPEGPAEQEPPAEAQEVAEPEVTAEPAQEPALEPDPEPRTDYQLEVRSQQTVGREIFYPAAGEAPTGLFLCTFENLNFLDAAAEGGYAPADGEITLYLLPGDGAGEPMSLRALAFQGQVTAPECPAELGRSAKTSEFLGWLTADGETLYAPGDRLPVAPAAGEAVLCAYWGACLQSVEVSGDYPYAPWPSDDLRPAEEPAGKPERLPAGYAAAVVFDGWLGSDGISYDPGDRIPVGVALEPTWAWAVVGYMSVIGESRGWLGMDHYLSTAMTNLADHSQDKDDKYRNIIVVDVNNAELRAALSGDELPALACTVTGFDPVETKQYSNVFSMDAYTIRPQYIFTRLTKPMLLHHIELKASHSDGSEEYYIPIQGTQTYFDAFYANNQKLIMGEGIHVTGTLNIFGGAGGSTSATSVSGDSSLSIFSGNYQRLYGGSCRVAMSGNRNLHFLGGTANDVFGGGYQKEKQTSGVSKVFMAGGTVLNNLVASSDQGTVTGSTELTMVGGKVEKNVYGGGNQAVMTGSTSITVHSGAVGGSVYGGGSQAKVTGSTAVSIKGGTVTGNVYGGGDVAEVEGDPSVTVSGGTVGGSVYGGGYSDTAAVTGSTRVTVSGGTVAGDVYGGGDQAAVQNVTATENGTVTDSGAGGATNVTVSGGTVLGNLYGGGQGKAGSETIIGAVARSATVTVTGGTVGSEDIGGSYTNGNVYGGGSQGSIGMDNRGYNADTNPVFTKVEITGGRLLGSVYGGSYCGKVGLGSFNTDESAVTANPVGGSTTVTISQSSFVGGDVFGGGSGISTGVGLGAVFGDTAVEITGGSVGLRVFGGSSFARVTGNTTVAVTSDTGEVQIEKTIYGGSNGQGTTFNNTKYLVFGNSSVTVEQTANRLTIGGSIFGSGNLTRVKGTRTLCVKNLTGELDSLQRANTVTVESCDLVLTGAADKVDGTDLDFSIAQVSEEVRLIGSALTANTELNEVANFGSYKADGVTPAVKSDGNVLTVLAGKLLIIGTKTVNEAGTQTVTYGKVTGVTTLRWTGAAAGSDQGVFVHADMDSDIGDPEKDENGVQLDTGAFAADPEQAVEEGKSLRSGKTDSYHYWQLGGNTIKTRVVLHLRDITADANGYYQDTLTFPLPMSVPQGTEFVPVDANLERYTPILSENGEQILSMAVFDDTHLWNETYHSVKIVNRPNGDGTVDPALADLVFAHPETHYPVTAVAGLPYFTIDFSYQNRKVVGGTVSITLLAHKRGELPESDSLGRYTIEIELQGQGEGTSSGRAMAGRQYNRFGSADTPIPTIGTKDAVTAQIVLNYTPILDGDAAPEEYPRISVKNSATGEPVTGFRVLMADLSYPAAPRWYYLPRDKIGNASVSLTDLINARGLGPWVPPLQGQDVVDKNLLFLLDFRECGLETGEYYFCLEFPNGSCAACDVQFKAADPVESGSLSWEQTALTATAPGADLDFADGSLIRLTGLSGEAARSVKATGSNGAVLDLLAGDGAVFLPLPKLTRGETYTVNWDLSAVKESATVKAELFPLPAFQSGSLETAAATAEDLSLTATGGGETVSSGRAMVAKLAEKSGGVVDSAAGGELKLHVTPDRLETGERIAVSEIRRKTKAGPYDASYEALVENGWTCSFSDVPSDGGYDGTLTLPSGLAPGTYRVYCALQKDEVTLARCYFNFIVTA